MSEKHLQTTPAEIGFVFDNGTQFYLADQQVCVQLRWGPWDTRLTISDIKDAMKVGKQCQTVTIEFRSQSYQDRTSFQAIQVYLRRFGTNFRSCLEEIAGKPFPKSPWGGTLALVEEDATLHISVRPATRTYSPFASLAPLTAAPAKWTVPHAMRALWNGQFEGLKCTMRLTDDYAFDAADNFGRGAIANARAFCKSIIESPSGWRVSGGAESVSVACHSFDYNSFKLRISA